MSEVRSEQRSVSEATSQVETYLKEFFGAIDLMEAGHFSKYFSENGAFRFANHPPAVGRPAIEAVANSVFSSLNGIHHRLISYALGSDGTLLVEGEVTYDRKDGKKIQLPYACGFEFAEKPFSTASKTRPLIREYRSYVDLAPLFHH